MSETEERREDFKKDIQVLLDKARNFLSEVIDFVQYTTISQTESEEFIKFVGNLVDYLNLEIEQHYFWLKNEIRCDKCPHPHKLFESEPCDDCNEPFREDRSSWQESIEILINDLIDIEYISDCNYMVSADRFNSSLWTTEQLEQYEAESKEYQKRKLKIDKEANEERIRCFRNVQEDLMEKLKNGEIDPNDPRVPYSLRPKIRRDEVKNEKTK